MSTVDTSGLTETEIFADEVFAEVPVRAVPLKKSFSLKQIAIRGSAWTIVGYGAQQVLRLGSNLILTRLLFPEAFGLMALVSVFLQGLEMFSDIGVGPSLIQNRRGDEPDFYNTAWTIQVFRGFALWLGSCALAWPVAAFYGEPMLAQLLPVAGLTAVLAGFNSSKLALATRHHKLGRLTILDMGSHVLSIVCLVTLAWWLESAWALVLGGLVGATIRLTLSHTVLPGARNRFRWDRSALKDLMHFGRWIFLGTLLTFLGMHGDRLVLGRFLSSSELGVYSVALALAMLPTQLTFTLGERVLGPIYCRVFREGEGYAEARKLRLAVLVPLLLLGGVLALAGQSLISVLYDPRFHAAGWMLEVLSLGTIFALLTATNSPWLLAAGQPRAFALVQFATSLAMLLSALIGGWLFGLPAMVGSWVISRITAYICTTLALRRIGIRMAVIDFVAIASATSLAFVIIRFKG